MKPSSPENYGRGWLLGPNDFSEGLTLVRIPIIFVHDGDQKYFKAAVAQARKYSEDVVVLSMTNTTDLWAKFLRGYVHLSTNREDIEIFCFKRFFLMYDYMLNNSITAAVLLDSDVLIFEDISLMARGLLSEGASLGLCMPRMQNDMRMSYSAHTSFWTVDTLLEFCTYCIYVYKNERSKLLEKWDFHLRNQKSGGVCDMALLYMWAKDRLGVSNLLVVRGGKTVDDNINCSENYDLEEYKMLFGLKRVRFVNGVPEVKRFDGQKVVFRALHFQGRSKAYMGNVQKRGHLKLYLCLKRYIRNRVPGIMRFFKF